MMAHPPPNIDVLLSEGTNRGSDKAVTSPLHRRLYVMLRQELHMEHSEALSFPVREAIDTWASLAEQRGALELFTDDDMAYFEWHKEQEAAFLAAQGTN